MPRYPVDGHPLLTEASARLTPEALAAEAEIAELVLLLDDTSFEPNSVKHRDATLAVVRQVNYQVATGSMAFALSSESEGDQSRSYRDGGERGTLPVADPVAWRLARRIHPIRTRFVP